jgi:hypothetical protein
LAAAKIDDRVFTRAASMMRVRNFKRRCEILNSHRHSMETSG